jgi:hypothetical protein
MRSMTNLFIVAATALTLVAGGHVQGAPIGRSTGIGSGLGHQGTGPGWSNGTNQAPPPLTYSAPPGGYGNARPSFAPSATQSSPSFR